MRKLLIIFFLLASATSYAEDFKILFLNTESIKIGRTARVVGDVFSDAERIHWKDGKQAMKVLSLDSQKQYVLVSEDFKRRKMKSAKDFIVKNNRLSTRGNSSLSTVASRINDCIYVLDSVEIFVDFEPEEGEYFYLQIGERILPLESDKGCITFGADIWDTGEKAPVYADLLYHGDDSSDVLISPEILIVPLPNQVSLRRK